MRWQKSEAPYCIIRVEQERNCQGKITFFKVRENSENFILSQGKLTYCIASVITLERSHVFFKNLCEVNAS